MKKKIIIETILNTRFSVNSEVEQFRKFAELGLQKEWIDYRIDLFMKYALVSLLNQTNQNFLSIVVYLDSTEQIVLDALKKYDSLPENVLFVNHKDLNKVKYDYIKDSDLYYEVRLDSDDMYAPDFIDKLYKSKYYEGLECIICQDGYVYDISNNILAKWHHISPTFYTLVYKTSQFLQWNRYNLIGGHEGAINLNNEILQGDNFIFLVHEKNISSTIENRDGKIIIDDGEEKEKILKELKVPIYK